MNQSKIINSYIQSLREVDVLLLESFLNKSNIDYNNELLKNIYLEIKASDYYYLLIDRTFKTEEGPVFPNYELTSEGLKALRTYDTLQEYCDAQVLDLRENILSSIPNNANAIENPKMKSGQDIWEKAKTIAAILGFLTALIGVITKLMDFW